MEYDAPSPTARDLEQRSRHAAHGVRMSHGNTRGINSPLHPKTSQSHETFQPDEEETVKVLENALTTGYRHFDTAAVYNTEHCVGKAMNAAIARNEVIRRDLFITTKVKGHK